MTAYSWKLTLTITTKVELVEIRPINFQYLIHYK